MAKWGDKWQGKKGEKQNGLETPAEPHVNGEPGNRNEERLALLNAIGDSADEVRKESLADVTTESYNDLPGTAETIEKQASEATEEEQTEETPPAEEPQETPPAEEKPPVDARTFKLKINGVEQELTEEEVLARAQKVSAADQYLTEASKLYAEAQKTVKPPEPAQEETDYQALARAIQMGTEEDAVEAIRKLASRPALSQDEVVRIADSRFEQRTAFQRDLARFQNDYKDLLANDAAKALVLELDEAASLKGKPPGYARFKEAAEQVAKLYKAAPASEMTDKEQRKAQVKLPMGTGHKAPAQPEEREPTTSEVISAMAKQRGQTVVRAGN